MIQHRDMYKTLSTKQIAALIASTVAVGLSPWPILSWYDYCLAAYIAVFSGLIVELAFILTFVAPRDIDTYGLSYTKYVVLSVGIQAILVAFMIAFFINDYLPFLCVLDAGSTFQLFALYSMYNYNISHDQTHFKASVNKV